MDNKDLHLNEDEIVPTEMSLEGKQVVGGKVLNEKQRKALLEGDYETALKHRANNVPTIVADPKDEVDLLSHRPETVEYTKTELRKRFPRGTPDQKTLAIKLMLEEYQTDPSQKPSLLKYFQRWGILPKTFYEQLKKNTEVQRAYQGAQLVIQARGKMLDRATEAKILPADVLTRFTNLCLLYQHGNIDKLTEGLKQVNLSSTIYYFLVNNFSECKALLNLAVRHRKQMVQIHYEASLLNDVAMADEARRAGMQLKRTKQKITKTKKQVIHDGEVYEVEDTRQAASTEGPDPRFVRMTYELSGLLKDKTEINVNVPQDTILTPQEDEFLNSLGRELKGLDQLADLDVEFEDLPDED